MKKLAALATAALIVIAASQLVANVGATGQVSIDRRVAALEKKAVALQKKLKSAQSQVTTLKNDWTCLHARGVSQFGDPLGTPRSGYSYSADSGASYALVPALAFSESRTSPDIWVVTTVEGCIPGGGA